jgi:hypothetical protein
MGTEVMATRDMETVIIVILMVAATIITVMDILIIIPGAIGMAAGMGMGQGQGQALEVGDEITGQGGRTIF